MFEVGKRYHRINTKPAITPPKCVYVTDVSTLKSTGLAVAVLKYEAGAEVSVDRGDWRLWEEYKEPRTAKAWIRVWDRGNEGIQFGLETYKTEKDARRVYNSRDLVTVVLIEYVEKI